MPSDSWTSPRCGRPRIVYWNNTPSPSVVGRFNALADRGNLHFEAWFNERHVPIYSWEVNEAEWRFRARYIPTRSILGFRLQLPAAELVDTRPQLIVSLYASASFACGFFAARAVGARTVFRVLPTYDTWFRRSKAKEFLKHFLFRAVDGVKVPGPDGANVARRYGIPDDRIHVVTQSIDVEHYSRALTVDAISRRRQREQLGLRGCVFLYVGRLWSGKGLDYLLQAYRTVNKQQADISMLLVGDGVDEGRYRAMASRLPGVTFAGFVQPRALPKYYGLSDVLVFPTLGDPHGLVVEEAMAAGLPVICTEAAGDIRQRQLEGKTGYIVPPADAGQFAERMLRLANDRELRLTFSSNARQLVANRGHECWAKDFEALVERMLSMPPCRTPASFIAHTAGRGVLAVGGKTGGPPAPVMTA